MKHHLIHKLRQGTRLPKPSNCPETIYELIKSCFCEIPHQRPSFDEIKNDLKLAYDALSGIAKASRASSNKMKSTALKQKHTQLDKMNQRIGSEGVTHATGAEKIVSMHCDLEANSVGLENVNYIQTFFRYLFKNSLEQ